MKTLKQIREIKKPTGGLKKACWTGYTAVGMKMKGGRKVPNCVPEEVELNEKKDFILDGGQSEIGVESTIIHCLSRNYPKILRSGFVTQKNIEEKKFPNFLRKYIIELMLSSHTWFTYRN